MGPQEKEELACFRESMIELAKDPYYAKKLKDFGELLFEMVHGIGIQDFVEKERLESVKRCVQCSITPEVIASSFELPLEQVLEIQAQLKLKQA